MILTKGNILDADGLKCIPVNMVGVPGAGLAKAWADRVQTPEIIMYKKACWGNFIRDNTLILGEWWLFPTKDHWKNTSNWFSIRSRLHQDIKHIVENTHVDCINIPKIGCGLGGLNWNDIYPLLTDILLGYEQENEGLTFRVFI